MRTEQLSVDSEKIVLSVPYTDSLPESLDKVESEKKNLGVTGISVSLITLEQVFLKYVFSYFQHILYILLCILFFYCIVRYRVVKKEDDGKHLNELFTASLQKVTGHELCMQSTLALLRKKFTYTQKNLVNLFIIVRIFLHYLLYGCIINIYFSL